jgi:hypothetical protein
VGCRKLSKICLKIKMIPNIKEKIKMSTMQICIIEVNNLFKLKQIQILQTEKGTCNVSVYQPGHHYFDIHFYDIVISLDNATDN